MNVRESQDEGSSKDKIIFTSQEEAIFHFSDDEDQIQLAAAEEHRDIALLNLNLKNLSGCADLPRSETVKISGNYGKIYLGLFNKERVAIKVISTNQPRSNPVAECYLHSYLSDHAQPYVTQCMGGQYSVIDCTYQIVLEYMDKGSLRDVLFGVNTDIITFETKEDVIYQMVDCMRALHAFDVFHRDIKLDNFLVKSPMKIKLADFGLSQVDPLSKSELRVEFMKHFKVVNPVDITMKFVVGTPLYMAPEVMTYSFYGKPADMYSLSFGMAEVMTGQDIVELFDGITVNFKSLENFRSNIARGVRPALPDTVPVHYQHWMRRAWENKRDSRPSAEQLLGEMREIKSLSL